ncbi:MAG TPA: alpha/beta fold hydrolase [Solirubrobacteraceae bacterium]|nr:alpha/beta fold hydrolase [Solirubrobacteraceae bacterium]
MIRAALVAVLTLLATAAPAAAQAPGVPPPGANDFDCRSPAHPVPVILVHGTFGDMTVSWNLVSPALKARGYCVFALDLVRRGMAPIDRSADKLAAFVDEVLARTGAAQVSLVGHSQGGMLGRYVAKFRGKLDVIDDIVGLAPSTHGTTSPLAPLVVGLGCPACGEQRAGSAFMQRLNAPPEAPPPPSYTVISTRYDEVVTPYRSQALEGATNVVLQERCPEDITDHVGIVYDPVALEWTLDALGRPGPADPAFVPTCSSTDGGGSPPFLAVARKRARVGADRAGVRVACFGSVGRCAGRLVLRDRRGRLGSVAVDIAAGKARTLRVPLSRAPRTGLRGIVTTLQPGGYVKATLRLRGSQDG